jgi:putative SOS response-associated peptidase YedK
MCGRAEVHHSSEEIRRHLDLDDESPEINASYNLAPTDPIPVVRQSEKLTPSGAVPVMRKLGTLETMR